MIQGTLGPSRSFQGIQENKTTFYHILRWSLTLTCDDIITNSVFVCCVQMSHYSLLKW